MENTGPKDPATALELQAEDLRRTNLNRQKHIEDLAAEIANLVNLIERDKNFASQYDAAAAELRATTVVFHVGGNI